MSKLSSLLMGMHHVKMAKEYFDDVVRESPGTVGALLSDLYGKKMDWVIANVYTNTKLSKEVIDGIREEVEADNFTIPEIIDRIVMLNPQQREALNFVINQLLEGHALKVEMDETIKS